ncbi:MAG: radical SAM protein, partial [Limisphaerales bacterium]
MQATLVNPVADSTTNINAANNLVTAALSQANVKSITLGTMKPLAAPPATPSAMVDVWHKPVRIELNHFKYKSLSDWKCNIAMGCEHGCLFCYVPGTSTKFQKKVLKERYGVDDHDAQWGEYVLLRQFDEAQILKDIRAAENRPLSELSRDGNRAVMLCSTTDAYQTITSPNKELQRRLNAERAHMVRRILELIRDNSTLNVRILTRSPLARQDFDLFASLGNRLTFGMSLPTLDNQLARIYEPNAPSPTQRLATLHAARDRGLNIFVAVAPTYAECDEADIRATLAAVKELNPLTIYHEPINVRADNIERIARHAEAEGKVLNTAVFDTPSDSRAYATDALRLVQSMAQELGLENKLHLWPDAGLKSENGFHETRTAAWKRHHP